MLMLFAAKGGNSHLYSILEVDVDEEQK